MFEHLGPAAADVAAIAAAACSVIAHVPQERARYADDDLPGVVQALLKLRAVAEGAALAVVMEADERGVVKSSTAAGLGQWLRTLADQVDVPLTGGEAAKWVHLAGECRRPDSGVLRAACTSGRVPVAIGSVLGRELRGMRSQVDAHLWDVCADALTGSAVAGAGAADLRRAVDVVLTQYGDREWIEQRTREAHQRRGFTRFTPDGHGTWSARVTLDGDAMAQVEAVIGALSAPRPRPDGQLDSQSDAQLEDQPQGELDARTATQRRADGLVEACALVADRQRVPEDLAGIGNGCAQVVVTMDYEQLAAQVGYGLTLDGQPVAPSTVRRLACEGRIIPMVLGTDGQPLDVGREHRLATPAQVRALRQRDKGCTFPACDRPPSWCQAHHLRHWLNFGPTDLDNLTLLCQRHHTIVHRDGHVGKVTRHGVRWHLPDRAVGAHD